MLPSDDCGLSRSDEHDSGRRLTVSPSFEGGLLVVWGCGEFGQHGHGHVHDVPSADAVGSPLWLGQDRLLTSVACGSSHTLAITDDNKLYSWGNSNSGQLGIGTCDTNSQPQEVLLGMASNTNLWGIICGTRHSFVWTEHGDAFSFGNNYSAQLGYDFRKPDFKENQLRPIFVDTLLHRTVCQVACGARHSVFLFGDGKVASVGANNRGQLGNDSTVDSECPVNVPDLAGVCFVACGNSHSLAADGQGNIYAWGYGKACGSRTDVLCPALIWTTLSTPVQSLAGGDSHSMFLQSNGKVFTWGNNFEGQLGQGNGVKFRERPAEVLFDIQPDDKIVCISAGENISAAVTESGQLFLWGKNASNVIREDKGPRAFQYEPHPIDLGHWKVHKVSCGSWHVACIVTDSGKPRRSRPGVSNGVQGGGEELPSENVLVRMYHRDDDVDAWRKNETENDTNTNRDERQAASEEWREDTTLTELDIHDGVRVRDTGVLPGQPDLGQGAKQAEEEDTAACNGCDENESRPSPEPVASLPSWLAGQTHTGEKLDRNSRTVQSPERPGEELSNQWPGTDQETGECRGVGAEDSLSGKRPIPCAAPPSCGSDADEFEVCFETTLFQPVKDVRRTSGSETSADSPEGPTKLPSFAASEEPAAGNNQAGPEHYESDTAEEDSEVLIANEKLAKSRRARVMSDATTRAMGDDPLAEAHSRLKCNSLTNLTLGFVYDVRVDPSQPEKVSSSPPSSRYFAKGKTGMGQLHREKKAPRTLRRVSWDAQQDYYLPNQPMHSADVPGAEWQRRPVPQPPMHRTQSNPTLYSSNKTWSPPASAQVSSKSSRPLAPAPGIGGLPPRPPAGRKPGGRRPLFSSGTSWRTRK